MNKLFYAITVSTEIDEVKILIEHIKKHCNNFIVVQYDTTKATSELIDVLKSYDNLSFYGTIFKNNFADFKNSLNSFCVNLGADYIFQLDADEIPNEYLIKKIPQIIELNPSIDLYLIPRINIVNGVTDEHLKQWNWVRNDKGYLNFPDHQGRIYKSNLKWFRQVHEQIIGAKNITRLPEDEKYCIIHHKVIEKQEHQNNYYLSLE